MENKELEFEFEVVQDAEVVPGLANANALVHDPFAWQVED